jgi:amino acid permease
MSTAVGTGVLAIPYVMYQSGIIFTTVLMIFGAFLAYWTMVWIVDASFKTKKNNFGPLV